MVAECAFLGAQDRESTQFICHCIYNILETYPPFGAACGRRCSRLPVGYCENIRTLKTEDDVEEAKMQDEEGEDFTG